LSGSTTFTDPLGKQTFLPGGVLVTTANMGRYYQSAFAVAPEGHFNLGYQLTPFVTVRLGYSFIYLSNVARPGDQVTRVTSPNRIPSDPSYGAAGPNPPAFQFHTTSYWAQGLNFGLDLRF
ncbi:MAG: BBP7 family outer membrane beta-barrel protein, partial [Pirellulales bacterium]